MLWQEIETFVKDDVYVTNGLVTDWYVLLPSKASAAPALLVLVQSMPSADG